MGERRNAGATNTNRIVAGRLMFNDGGQPLPDRGQRP